MAIGFAELSNLEVCVSSYRCGGGRNEIVLIDTNRVKCKQCSYPLGIHTLSTVMWLIELQSS